MTNSVSYVTLNFQSPNTGVVAYAVQDDTLSHTIVASLVDGSTLYTPGENAMGAVRYRKPDGTAGLYTVLEDGSTPAVTFDGNTATIRCAAQMLTAAGDVAVQLQLYEDAGRLSTLRFTLHVQADVVSDVEIESTDYYNILAQQIADVLNAADSLTGMTTSGETLPVGSQATVEISGGSGGVPYNLHFGIPQGPAGPAATVQGQTVSYQESESGTTVPTGTWSARPPSPVTPGRYLWTRTVVQTNGGNFTTYSVAYNGINGTGAVNTVAGIQPDAGGNVPLGDYLIERSFTVTLPSAFNYLEIPFTTPTGYTFLTCVEPVFSGAAIPYCMTRSEAAGCTLYPPAGATANFSNAAYTGATVTARVLYVKTS